MNVLPTALELLADSPVTRRAGAAPSAQRRPRSVVRTRSAQLPLALPLGRRAERRSRSLADTTPFAPPPALDAVAAAGALWAGLGAAGAVTRLDAPEHGWPDALVQPGDAVLVAKGGAVAEGALAALCMRGTDAVQLLRMHRSGDRHLRLQPENRTVPPLIVAAVDVELIGPVLTIVRRGAGEPAARRRTA